MSFLLWLLTAGLCALLVVADRSPSDHGSEPIFFNVASKANVTATSTCGEGKKPTTWCPFTFTGNNLGFGCDECDAKKPDKRHPISFAVDGHKTWWQSEIYPGEVNVTVDLRQQFHVSSVVLKIGPSLPPRNWILEKSEDGVSFTPWQYFAGTVKECLELFGKRTNGKPKFIEDTICVTIKSKLQNMDFGEIAVNLLAFRPDADNFTFSERLQKWTKASHVRLRLLQPHTLEGHYYLSAHHDDSFKRLIFYSLRDITILARCICHGHSNTCEWNSTVHRFECRCLHNTCGEECKRCCDGFVQFPWKPGHVNVNFTCEPCNCFGHSHDCVYNVTVDMKNLSLDTAGRKRGGGVCLNCQNNTIGINCEQCAPGYFRPKILPLTSACEDCQCHVHGVYVRECDSTGQCRCRAKIQGKKCDRCLPGHWGFPHCSRCHCSPIGSLYMSCHEKTGQCSCKKNVIGKNCDQCYKNMILTINGCLDCDNCSLILKKEVRIYERAVGVWLHNVNHLGKTPTQRLQRSYLTHIEHRVQELHEQMKYHSLGNVEIIISSYLSYPVDGTLHSSVTILENALRSNMKATATAFRNSTNLANEAEYTLSLARLRYNGTGLFQAWRETKDLVDYVLEMAFAFNAKSKPKENEDNSIHAGAKLLVDIKKVDFCAPKRKAEQEVVAAEELYRVFNGTCHRISSNLYSCMPENYKSRLQQVTKSTAELHLLSRNILQNKTKIQNLNWDNKAAIKLIKGRIDDRKQYEHQFQIVKHLVSSSANLLQDAEQDWLAIIRHKKPLLEKTSRLHDTLRFLKNLPSEIKKSKYNSWKLHRQFTRLTETLDSTLRRTKKFMNTTTSRHFLKEANETALEILQAVQFWSFNVSKTLTRSKALEEWARFLLKLTQSATRVHLKSTVILDKDTNGEELEGSASGEGAVEDHMYIGEQGDEPLHSSEKLRQHPLGSPALESSNRSIQDPQVPNDMGDFWMDEQPLTHYALDQLRDMITNIREVNYGYLEEGLKCKTSAQNILTNLTTSVKLSNGIQSSLQIKNEFINTLKSFSSDHVKALPDYAIVQRNTWPTLKESFVKINERVHQLENRGKSLTKDICGDYQNCSLELFQQAASKTMDFVNIAAKCKKSSVHLAVARPHMTMFEQVNKKIASLREKIALAKKIARTIKGPVKFFSPGFTSPSLPEEISKPSAISRIEIAFHSEYEDGLIFSTSNATEAFQVFVTLTQSRVVVCATLNGERQCTVLSAYIPLMKWIHLSLIRIGNEFAVSLSAEGSVSSERTMIWESAVNVIVPLSFPVYVGGIPEEIKILKQNDFDGCLALTLNEHTVSLMTSDVQLGIQEFCTDSYARSYNKETIVSFNGKGYHKMTPNIMLTPMNLSFSFRTFEDRSLLLHVQGVKKTDYLSVWVEEGNILVVYRERSASMKLSTQLHNYHDGNWHEIQIKQEKNTWSLSVDNMDRDSSVFLYFVTQLPSHCVLLGGLDSYTQQLLPSWIHTLKNLTGCLSNITFQGNVLNVQDFESSRASRIGACQMPNSKCACLSSEQMSLRPLPSVVVHFVSFSFRTSASRSSLMMYRTSMHSLIHVYHENGRVNVHVRSRHLSGRYLDREDKVTANDGQWHTVLLLRNHNHSSTLMVDEFRMQFPDRLTESIYESQHFLYLGGPLNSESTGVCFKDVALNNRLMELASKHHISCNDRINKVTHQEDEIRLRKNELLK